MISDLTTREVSQRLMEDRMFWRMYERSTN